MLEIKALCAGYGRTRILNGASIVCPSGEITALIGKNGSGKSTLLRSAVGLADVYSGEIFANGTLLTSLSRNERAKAVAYLAQSKSTPDITVEKMVLHGRFPYLSYPRRYRAEDLKIAEEAMAEMDLLPLREKPLSALSGGMRQKVYIAMALCQRADIIMLDEPTAYLDIEHQYRLADILSGLARQGRTVLTVLHDIPLALRISSRIAVMHEGEIICVASPEQLLSSGIISEIFGVGISSLTENGKTEYFYTGVR